MKNITKDIRIRSDIKVPRRYNLKKLLACYLHKSIG